MLSSTRADPVRLVPAAPFPGHTPRTYPRSTRTCPPLPLRHTGYHTDAPNILHNYSEHAQDYSPPPRSSERRPENTPTFIGLYSQEYLWSTSAKATNIACGFGAFEIIRGCAAFCADLLLAFKRDRSRVFRRGALAPQSARARTWMGGRRASQGALCLHTEASRLVYTGACALAGLAVHVLSSCACRCRHMGLVICIRTVATTQDDCPAWST